MKLLLWSTGGPVKWLVYTVLHASPSTSTGLFVRVDIYLYSRGRQSPARGPNPAREFRPSGPRRLVSLTLTSARKTYRTMSDCFHAERDLVAH